MPPVSFTRVSYIDPICIVRSCLHFLCLLVLHMLAQGAFVLPSFILGRGKTFFRPVWLDIDHPFLVARRVCKV